MLKLYLFMWAKVIFEIWVIKHRYYPWWFLAEAEILRICRRKVVGFIIEYWITLFHYPQIMWLEVGKFNILTNPPTPTQLFFFNKKHIQSWCLSSMVSIFPFSNRVCHGTLLGTEHCPPLHRLRSTNLADAPPQEFFGASVARVVGSFFFAVKEMGGEFILFLP